MTTRKTKYEIFKQFNKITINNDIRITTVTFMREKYYTPMMCSEKPEHTKCLLLNFLYSEVSMTNTISIIFNVTML